MQVNLCRPYHTGLKLRGLGKARFQGIRVSFVSRILESQKLSSCKQSDKRGVPRRSKAKTTPNSKSTAKGVLIAASSLQYEGRCWSLASYWGDETTYFFCMGKSLSN